MPLSPPSSRTRLLRPRRKARSCDTNSIVPSKSFSASSSISFVARSRWFVGSSRIRKLGGLSSMRASTRRVFSPPERANRLVHVVARELKRAREVAQHANRFAGEVLLKLLLDRQARIQQVERL